MKTIQIKQFTHKKIMKPNFTKKIITQLKPEFSKKFIFAPFAISLKNDRNYNKNEVLYS